MRDNVNRRSDKKEPVFYLFLAGATALFLYLVATNTLQLGDVLGEWMWNYRPLRVAHKLWFPISVFIFFSAIILLLLKVNLTGKISRPREFLNPLILFLLGFALNMSVFSLSEFGLDELPFIIVHSGRTSFFTDIVKVRTVSSFLENYPSLISHLTHHSQVHGPGSILFFWFLNFIAMKVPFLAGLGMKIAHFFNMDLSYFSNLLISSGLPANQSVVAASIFSGLLISLLCYLTVIPLYYLAKDYYDRRVAFYSCVMYAVVPNIILFTPQMAQIFTLFAVGIVSAFYFGIRKKKLSFILLSSLIFSVSIFFSLECLALLPMMFLLAWGLLFQEKSRGEQVENNRNLGLSFLIKVLAFFLACTVIFYLGVFCLFRFNVVESYRVSMHIHDVLEARRPYFKWVWGNPLEFFAFLGIPLLLLFLRKIAFGIKRAYREGLGKVDVFLIAFVLTFLVLDLLGINRGEVARLWIFLAPFVVMFCASAIREIGNFANGTVRESNFLMVLVFVLQFVQVIVLKASLYTLPLRF